MQFKKTLVEFIFMWTEKISHKKTVSHILYAKVVKIEFPITKSDRFVYLKRYMTI